MIYKERTSGDVGISVGRAKDFAIYHNTVMLNGTFAWTIEYRWSNSNGVIAYNLTDGAIRSRNSASAELTGNITVAGKAWFAGADSVDFHLLPDCPAVDAAEALEWVTLDFDSQARPGGAAPDVGADEWFAPYERGDINKDGTINIFDLLELLGALGTDSDDSWLDLDSSGRVDIFDLLELLKLLQA